MLALQRARRVQGALHIVLPTAIERVFPYAAVADVCDINISIYGRDDSPALPRAQARYPQAEIFAVRGGGAAGLAAVIEHMIDPDAPHVVVDPDGGVAAVLHPTVRIAWTPEDAMTELCS